MSKLTNKQKCFVDEYLIDLNATQAAIRAGYSVKTAYRIGAELLQKTSVSEYIQQRMKDREIRTEITQDKVLKELANIAFANGTDFAKVIIKKVKEPIYKENEDTGKKELTGYKEHEYQAVEVENTDSIPKEKKAAIAGIKETKYGIAVESCDKVKALELLGKHLGMFTDKVENTNINLNDDISNLTDEELEEKLKKYNVR